MIERIAAKFTLQIIIAALVVGALIVQTVRIEGLRIPLFFWTLSIPGYAERIANEKKRSAELTAELARISDTKNAQREETGKNIAEAEKQIVYVDRIVREIENRPLPGNCVTPDLEAWRGVL